MLPRPEAGSRAPIVDAETFKIVTALEMRKALRLQYYVSLLAVEPTGPDHVAARTSALALQVARAISHEIRATDLIGLVPHSPCLYVLLVSAGVDSLPRVIERLGLEVTRYRFALERGDEPVHLAIGAGCFPATARDERDLLAQAQALARQAQRDVGEVHRYRVASELR